MLYETTRKGNLIDFPQRKNESLKDYIVRYIIYIQKEIGEELFSKEDIIREIKTFKYEIGQEVYFLYKNNISKSEIRVRKLYETDIPSIQISYKLKYPYEDDQEENSLYPTKEELIKDLAKKAHIKILVEE